MAMLAEPRRRKRYNLCPRGKALYEDDTRFGTKMLEKMGWSKGRGLGANLDGSKEFVRVRFKNDAEGLGYEMRDDQWTEHEDGFNGLLKALNEGGTSDKNDNAGNSIADNGNASEEESRPMGFGFKSAAAAEAVKPKTLKDKISGVSLEEKSKHSKARVHYKKFTRGKDLAQYSEKDLANIFGKKAIEENAAAPIEDIPAEQKEEEVKPVNPNFAGVQTVSTGLSVNDYFKQKMEAMKNRLFNIACSKIDETNSFLMGTEMHAETATANGSEEEGNDTTKKKMKNKDKKEIKEQTECVLPEETVTEKKKKKKLKLAAEDGAMESEVVAIKEEETNSPKRKKKKVKKETEEWKASPEVTEVVTKKEKKSINVLETADETPEIKKEPTDEPEQKQVASPKTKKNSKKSKNEVADLTQDDQTKITEEAAAKKPEEVKPPKKIRKVDAKNEPTVEPEQKEETASKTKKKSKTFEPSHVVDHLTQDDQTIIESESVEVEKIKAITVGNEQNTKKRKSKRIVETAAETPETIEPPKKKSKKDAKEELTVLPEPKEETAFKTKKKSKKTAEPTIDLPNEDQATTTTTTEPAQITTKSKNKTKSMKHKSKVSDEAVTVSSGDESDSEAEANADQHSYLSMDQLIKKLDSYNEFQISSFCAEKFHILNMNAFKNSTLAQITGYTIDDNIKLKIVEAKSDALRIMDLWEGKQSKYFSKTMSSTSKAFKKRFWRLNPTDIKRISRIKAFSGI